MSRRTERIGEQLRSELSRLLREEVTDPRLGPWITVTRVDVAPDLSHAAVLWSVLPGPGAADPDDTARGLERAAPWLRRQLARVLRTKRTPELRFHHDPSLEHGSRTLELLADLAPEPDPPEEAGGSGETETESR